MPPKMPPQRKRRCNAAEVAEGNETWVSVGDELWEKVGDREQAAIERKRRRQTRQNMVLEKPTANIVFIDLTDDITPEKVNIKQNQPTNTLPVFVDTPKTEISLALISNVKTTKEIAQCKAQENEMQSSQINSLNPHDQYPSTSKILPNEYCPNILSAVPGNTIAYLELMKLQQCTLIPNVEKFECEICMVEYGAGEGVVLHECIHTFCRECLGETIRQCAEPQVPCPSSKCDYFLQDREVRALVPEQDYESWLSRGLSIAEGSSRDSFHCRYQDCIGWAICDPEVSRFPCPVCERINCIQCQAIHESETCEEYSAKIKEAANGNASQLLIQSLVERGEAMLCPECSAVITKSIGCDWLLCAGCKTEICWITKGRRWGPHGRGDTSGGCRCGVKRKKCHPHCGNCH